MAIKLTANQSDQIWQSIPIGEPLYLRDDLAGVPIPSPNSALYRFIRLTADDPYNNGVLVNQNVTGVAPQVLATAVVNMPASPLHGRTVDLLNTERRVLRAGQSGLKEQDAFQGHRMGTVPGSSGNWAAVTTGGTIQFPTGGTAVGLVATSGDPVTDTVNGQPRTAIETRVKSQGNTAYMRIF